MLRLVIETVLPGTPDAFHAPSKTEPAQGTTSAIESSAATTQVRSRERESALARVSQRDREALGMLSAHCDP